MPGNTFLKFSGLEVFFTDWDISLPIVQERNILFDCEHSKVDFSAINSSDHTSNLKFIGNEIKVCFSWKAYNLGKSWFCRRILTYPFFVVIGSKLDL